MRLARRLDRDVRERGRTPEGVRAQFAATVAPMVYVQIIVAIAIGVVFYRDYPDLVALAGTGVIIASGIYLLRDGRR